MSLNRIEEQLMEYVQRHPDERHFIQDKVRSLVAAAPDEATAAARLTEVLVAYYRERCAVVPELRHMPRMEGPARYGLRNLAENLIRKWGPIKNKNNKPSQEPGI